MLKHFSDRENISIENVDFHKGIKSPGNYKGVG